jgi:hypothetical protein
LSATSGHRCAVSSETSGLPTPYIWTSNAVHLDFQRRDLLMSDFRISSRFCCSMSCSARDRWPSFYYDVLRRVFCNLALCLTLGLQGQVTSTLFAFRDSSTLMLTHGFCPVPPRGSFSFLPCPSLPSLPSLFRCLISSPASLVFILPSHYPSPLPCPPPPSSCSPLNPRLPLLPASALCASVPCTRAMVGSL